MFGFGFKVHADTREVDVAERKVARFADSFHNKFSKRLGQLFGAGALVGATFRLVDQVFGKPEEIQKLANQWGVTTDEIQLAQIAAKEAGKEFGDYMKDATKNLSNFRDELERVRGQNGLELISPGDIQAINELKGASSGFWQSLVNRAAKVTGASVRAGKALLGGEFREAGRQGIRALGAASPLALPSDWLDKVTGADKGEASQSMGGFIGGPIFDPRVFSAIAMQKQLEGLQAREADLKAPREWLKGDLTGSQSIGAYSSQQGGVVKEQQETNKKLDEISDEVKALETALKTMMK